MARTVLVTDDSASMRHVRATWFGVLGWDVRTAEDGEDALAALDEGVPDLLVTDNAMPGMSGLELVVQVRRRYGSALPIVMVTADPTVETVIAAVEAGTDDYLTKPITVDRLTASLSGLRLGGPATSAA